MLNDAYLQFKKLQILYNELHALLLTQLDLLSGKDIVVIGKAIHEEEFGLKRISTIVQEIKKALQRLLADVANNLAEVKRTYKLIRIQHVGYTQEQCDIIKEIHHKILDQRGLIGVTFFRMALEEYKFIGAKYDQMAQYYEKEGIHLKTHNINGYLPELSTLDITQKHALSPDALEAYLYKEKRIPRFIKSLIEKRSIPLEVHKADAVISVKQAKKEGFTKFFRLKIGNRTDRTYFIAFSPDARIKFFITDINGNDLLIKVEAILRFAGIPEKLIKTTVFFKRNTQYFLDSIKLKASVAAIGMSGYVTSLVERMRKTALFEKIQMYLFNYDTDLIEHVHTAAEHGYGFNFGDKTEHIPIKDKGPLIELFKKEPLYSLLMSSAPDNILSKASYYNLFAEYFLKDWKQLVDLYLTKGIKLPKPALHKTKDKPRIEEIFGFTSKEYSANGIKVIKITVQTKKDRKRTIILTGYPYGDLSYYLTQALIQKKVRSFFFSGTFGGFPIELFEGRSFRKGDLIAPSNELLDLPLFEEDVKHFLGAHEEKDPIEDWYRNEILVGVHEASHTKFSTVLLEFEHNIKNLIKQKYESVEVEIYEIIKAIAEHKKRLSFASVLLCSDIVLREGEEITVGYGRNIIMVKNRILDYLLEYLNIGYPKRIRKKIQKLAKDSIKREGVITKK